MSRCKKAFVAWLAERHKEGHCPTSSSGWDAAWQHQQVKIKKLRKMATRYSPRYVNGLENAVANLEAEIEQLQEKNSG